MRAFLRRELRRQLHVNAGIQVTFVTRLADRGHPETLQPEDLAVLCQRRNAQPRRLAAERRHVRFAAQHRRGHWQRRLHIQVSPFVLELSMWRQADAEVQITRGGAANAMLALSGYPHARAVAHAGGYPDVDGARLAILLERQAPRCAVIGVLERELDFVFDVATCTLPCPASCAAGAGARIHPSPAEERGEEVG